MKTRLAWGLALAGLLCLGSFFGPRTGMFLQGKNDFLPFYVAGSLAPGKEIYDERPYREFAAERFQTEFPYLVYIRPPFYALLLKPISWLPYPVANFVWTALRLAALVALMWIPWGPGRMTVLAAVCWAVPVYSGLLNGQDAIFLPAILALACRLQWSNPRAAGLVLSLCAIKFHLFITLPLLGLRKGSRPQAYGFLVGAGLLAALSFVAAGWSWPVLYGDVLLDDELMMVGSSSSPYLMPNLHGLTSALPGGPLLEWSLAAVVFVVTAWIVPRIEFGPAMAVIAAAGVLLSYHAFVADWVLVLFACLLMLKHSAPGDLSRLLAVALLTPLPSLFQIQGYPFARLPPLLLLACWAVYVAEVQRRSTTCP